MKVGFANIIQIRRGRKVMDVAEGRVCLVNVIKYHLPGILKIRDYEFSLLLCNYKNRSI